MWAYVSQYLHLWETTEINVVCSSLLSEGFETLPTFTVPDGPGIYFELLNIGTAVHVLIWRVQNYSASLEYTNMCSLAMLKKYVSVFIGHWMFLRCYLAVRGKQTRMNKWWREESKRFLHEEKGRNAKVFDWRTSSAHRHESNTAGGLQTQRERERRAWMLQRERIVFTAAWFVTAYRKFTFNYCSGFSFVFLMFIGLDWSLESRFTKRQVGLWFLRVAV